MGGEFRIASAAAWCVLRHERRATALWVRWERKRAAWSPFWQPFNALRPGSGAVDRVKARDAVGVAREEPLVQSGARRHGNDGIPGNRGNVVPVSYRL